MPATSAGVVPSGTSVVMVTRNSMSHLPPRRWAPGSRLAPVSDPGHRLSGLIPSARLRDNMPEGEGKGRLPMTESRVRAGRVYDQPTGTPARRVLVDRLWPRGLTKARAALDAWCKQ